MKKIILLSIGALIFNLLLVLIFLFPLVLNLNSISNDIIALKKNSASVEKELGIAEQFNNSYNSLELKKENIDQFLVSPEVPVELIQFFEKSAEDFNLTINILPSSSKESKKDLWNSMGFNIELTGDFLNFLKFLEKIETSHYFLEIQGLQSRKISKNELYLEKYEGFSDRDVKTILKIKVYTK